MLAGLSVLGLTLSLYFTLAYYGRLRAPALPAALCQVKERSCLGILNTPYARLAGVPNGLVGIGFYLLTVSVAGFLLAGARLLWLERVALVAATAAVLLAPYLVWALRVRLHSWCGL